MSRDARFPRSGPPRCSTTRGAAILALTCATALGPISAGAPPTVAEETRAASEAAAHEFEGLRCMRKTDEPMAPRELERGSQSLLRWSNPTAGRVYGDVFLWTDGGHPAVIASIYRWYHPYRSLTAEFCALTDSTLAVERDERTIWSPTQAPVKWRPVPGAGPPAHTRAARLRQMRTLTSRFRAILTDTRLDTGGVSTNLRLLTQPLYQYDLDTSPRTGGALFAFVAGTDPELILMLEGREQDAEPMWHYALARMNRDILEVRLDDESVWSVGYLNAQVLWDTRQPYCCVELPLPDGAADSPPASIDP